MRSDAAGQLDAVCRAALPNARHDRCRRRVGRDAKSWFWFRERLNQKPDPLQKTPEDFPLVVRQADEQYASG